MVKPAYYNEIDKHAAAWLRNLIAAGHIAPGDVDERDIRDVHPDDLRGYTQCHFFAGIGVWSYALRRAGWPDDREIWTGSCPCQPFSAAGAGLGFVDERHLWPHFHWLVQQRRPAVVAGEQVASKDSEPWVDLVQDDLEALGYAFGAIPFPAASVGAPHIRDRLYWVGDARSSGLEGYAGYGGAARWQGQGRPAATSGVSGGLADGDVYGCLAASVRELHHAQPDAQSCGRAVGLGYPYGLGGGRDAGAVLGAEGSAERSVRGVADAAEPAGAAVGVADSERDAGRGEATAADHERTQAVGPADRAGGCGSSFGARPGPTNGFWGDADWLSCRDGKWRPVEPSTQPLAYGTARGLGSLPAGLRGLAEVAGVDGQSLTRAKSYRVGGLRGFGNAINSEAAIAFIEAAVM